MPYRNAIPYECMEEGEEFLGLLCSVSTDGDKLGQERVEYHFLAPNWVDRSGSNQYMMDVFLAGN